MSTTAAAPASTSLWGKSRIPIIGLTGEPESGKTVCGLTIAPPREDGTPRTLYYDTEKSGETYDYLGAHRIDVPDMMGEMYPGGYNAAQVFMFFRESMKAVPRKQFDLIFLDVAEDVETGLADWVWQNPTHFRHTQSQYQKMAGIFWNDCTTLWKAVLSDVASKCETFVFSVHTGLVWKNNEATKEKRPKGKRTLMELATLYLHLERLKNEKGMKQQVPSANVLKSRLMHKAANGELIPILPPRLPICTPAAIREYISSPTLPSDYTEAQLAPEAVMTDVERLELERSTANAKADLLRLQIEAESKKQPVAATQRVPEATPLTPPTTPIERPAAPPTNGHTITHSNHLGLPLNSMMSCLALWNTACDLTGVADDDSGTRGEMLKQIISDRFNGLTLPDMTEDFWRDLEPFIVDCIERRKQQIAEGEQSQAFQ